MSFQSLINKLAMTGQSNWYWAGLLLLGIMQEVIALYYQYVLHKLPCVLCIHVRIWVMAMILVAILGLSIRKKTLRNVAQVFIALISLGLLDRSWQLLGVERGFILGSCSMDPGLPSWFALDKWFPFMFEVQDMCGYTPVLLFGITMAEALLVLSAVLLLLSSILAVSGVAVTLKSKTGT